MAHPRAASRHPLKGAIPVARQSRFHGISGRRHFAPEGLVYLRAAISAHHPQWGCGLQGAPAVHPELVEGRLGDAPGLVRFTRPEGTLVP